MFVTNWISTTKIQKISEITNFFRHYFLSRTEVKVLRKEADTYAKQYRELDLKIQSLNWTVDLVDLQDLPR